MLVSIVANMVGSVIKRVGNMRLVGRVVSDKMQKTVVVRVDHKVWHTKYHRWFVRRKRFFAHDHGASYGEYEYAQNFGFISRLSMLLSDFFDRAAWLMCALLSSIGDLLMWRQ